MDVLTISSKRVFPSLYLTGSRAIMVGYGSMAKILLAWELGYGFGHLIPHLDLIEALQHRGHQIVLALKDLSSAHLVFGESGVQYLQAPVRPIHDTRERVKTYTFAHLLHNIGYSDTSMMCGLVKAWRTLFDVVSPDLAIFDYSPTALIASRDSSFIRVVYGQGFHIPPDSYPLPNLRLSEAVDLERLRQDEDRIVMAINAVLRTFALRPVASIADLFRAESSLLVTFQELDPYVERSGGDYRGIPSGRLQGDSPEWPSGEGKRILAYLKPCKALPGLLNELRKLAQPTIVVGSDISQDTRQRFRSRTIRFVNSVPDLDATISECDLGITHATITITRLLLAGKPLLVLPLWLEHALVARCARRLGACVIASKANGDAAAHKLRILMRSSRYYDAASGFARRYTDFDSGSHGQTLADHIDSLLR